MRRSVSYQFTRFWGIRTWVPLCVGISGSGQNPTNPWCQHPGRPPSEEFTCCGTTSGANRNVPAHVHHRTAGRIWRIAGGIVASGRGTNIWRSRNAGLNGPVIGVVDQVSRGQ